MAGARMLCVLIAVLFWAGLSPDSRANDSTAILESGALQLTASPHIALEREDLYLSVARVRVRYRFRNTSEADVTTLVAFPLPEIVVGNDAEYDVDAQDPANFIGFEVVVNGRELTPSLQLRATRFGVDQTALLERHGIPVLPFAQNFYQKLEKVEGAARRELEVAGLVDWSSAFGANNVPLPSPHWRARTAYYWTQTFPAGAVTEVSHSYRPVPGVSFFAPDILDDAGMRDAYCMEPGFRKAAARRFSQGQAVMRELHYVLSTGANWLGAIGEFRLTVDKGKPENLVSLCIDGIRKTGPTTFEAVKKNFIPERDLKILIVGTN